MPPLTKQGSGTLVLSGTNSYTRATTVSGGTPLVNGSISNSAVSVASGATLGGSGTSRGRMAGLCRDAAAAEGSWKASFLF